MVMRARHVRQGEVPEAADEAGAVHLGGLLLLAVERLQRGEQDQGGEGQPLPGDDDDDREERVGGEPVDGLQAEELGDVGGDAVAGVEDHVLPDERGDGRHDEERRDDEDAHDPLAEDRLVDQERDADAADDGDAEHAEDDGQRVADRLPEGGVGEEVLVVLEARPAAGGGVQQVVVAEGEVDRHRQRHDHPDQQEADGGHPHPARDALGLSGGHGVSPGRSGGLPVVCRVGSSRPVPGRCPGRGRLGALGGARLSSRRASSRAGSSTGPGRARRRRSTGRRGPRRRAGRRWCRSTGTPGSPRTARRCRGPASPSAW